MPIKFDGLYILLVSGLPTLAKLDKFMIRGRQRFSIRRCAYSQRLKVRSSINDEARIILQVEGLFKILLRIKRLEGEEALSMAIGKAYQRRQRRGRIYRDSRAI